MGFGLSKSHHSLGEHGIFGDEEAAALRALVDGLAADVAELKHRVDSQFTTTAAHAEIARQQAQFAREEARADLERTRDTLIELIDQLHRDDQTTPDQHVPGTSPGPSIAVQSERLETLERGLERLDVAIERSSARQRELAATMEAFLDTIMAERRGEPVAGLNLS